MKQVGSPGCGPPAKRPVAPRRRDRYARSIQNRTWRRDNLQSGAAKKAGTSSETVPGIAAGEEISQQAGEQFFTGTDTGQNSIGN